MEHFLETCDELINSTNDLTARAKESEGGTCSVDIDRMIKAGPDNGEYPRIYTTCEKKRDERFGFIIGK